MLEIIYRDDHLIAINKPAGLLVHRSNIDRQETHFAVQLLRDQVDRYVYPVHRLDKGTSGVLLFAFEGETVRRMARQFEEGAVEKTYLAVVRGWPPDTGTIDHPLSRRYDAYGRSQPEAEDQPAATTYQRLAAIELPMAVDRYPTSRYALVELQPLTGRQHQLRRHMKHIDHPIIGDATYGKGCHNRFFQREFGCHRLMLASVHLGFRHPVSDKPTDIRTTVGDQFSSVLDRFAWSQFQAPRPAAWPLAKQAVSK